MFPNSEGCILLEGPQSVRLCEANAVNMDIFDEVDLESSQMDEQLLAFSLPLKTQNATPAGTRQPKAIRRKVDEVPLGADSGETRTCTSWSMSSMLF